MKLLFNHGDNDASLELKELIGHIDKDINYDKLKSDLKSATTDVIKIIGQPVYDSVLAKYEAAEEDEADLELIYKLRYPIALNGYLNHAKASDVTHGNNGRKIRIDDQNKVPFEWMIKRDNEIFERKYYKALDDLIDYLDENNATWKASNAYTEGKKYFVNRTSDFDEYFPIQSRLLLIKLTPGIRQCERKNIKAVIGSNRYESLKTKIASGTALDESETDIVALIKEACVFFSLSWGMRVLRVTLFPEGVLQSYTPDRQSANATKPSEKMEAELAAQEFLNNAKEVLTEIQQKVTEYYPEEVDETVLDDIINGMIKFDDDDKFATT